MYSYSQLLIRNVILGIFFNILIAAMVIYFFSSSLADKQLNRQNSLIAVIDNAKHNNQLETLTKFIDLTDFQLISIKKYNEEILAHQTLAVNYLVSFITPKALAVTSTEKYTINYQLNSNNAAELILKILLVSIIASCIIILIACSLSIKHSKQLVFVVNKQIKQGIAQVISMNELEPSDDVIDIPELASGLKEVKALISSHIRDTSEL